MPKSRKMKKGQWGGSPAPVVSGGDASAGNYLLKVVGDGWTQFTNALMPNPGQNIVAAAQTEIVPIANPNANVPNYDKSLGQSGGRRRNKGRGRKGGFLGLGPVLTQAAVPVALLGMQHTYAKRKHRGGKRTRRHSRKH